VLQLSGIAISYIMAVNKREYIMNWYIKRLWEY